MKEKDYYQQLEGFTITKFIGVSKEDNIEGFPQFILKKKGFEDVLIEVSQDAEGNGGGFLFIGGVNHG
jgi:hypothetical protein